MFKALQLNKTEPGFSATVVSIDEAQLPAGNFFVTVSACGVRLHDGGISVGHERRNWGQVFHYQIQLR